MYYLFREYGVLPGAYYGLPAGEKVVIRAFFERDMELLRELGPKRGAPGRRRR